MTNGYLHAQSQPSRSRGIAAFEFALVLPLLTLFLLGTFVFGAIFLYVQAANFAAQEGARAAVAMAPGSTTATYAAAALAKAGFGAGGVLSFVPKELQGKAINIPTPTTPTDLVVSGATDIVVTVVVTPTELFPTLPASLKLPLLPAIPLLPGPITVTATGVLF